MYTVYTTIPSQIETWSFHQINCLPKLLCTHSQTKISRAHYFSWRHKDVENEHYSQQKCWRLTRFSLRWQTIICGKDRLRKTTYLGKQLHFNCTWHLQSYTTYTVPPPHRRFSTNLRDGSVIYFRFRSLIIKTTGGRIYFYIFLVCLNCFMVWTRGYMCNCAIVQESYTLQGPNVVKFPHFLIF